MPIPVTKPSREQMMKCVARFSDLYRADHSLPDCHVPGYERTLVNVIGFAPPQASADVRAYSPVGDQAKPYISHLKAGFGVAFVEAEPGKGVMMHNHDTNETFMPVAGTWRVTWEGDQGNDSVELGPLDLISVPPQMQRQFHCLSAPAGQAKGVLLVVIGGDQPSAEFSPEAEAILMARGLMPPAQKRAS
jgi:mannose-6-phosphate isomerase-like protein (cupin superfamily)